jgi:hypothetical protein
MSTLQLVLPVIELSEPGPVFDIVPSKANELLLSNRTPRTDPAVIDATSFFIDATLLGLLIPSTNELAGIPRV